MFNPGLSMEVCEYPDPFVPAQAYDGFFINPDFAFKKSKNLIR
jgi:hypothetical protein